MARPLFVLLVLLAAAGCADTAPSVSTGSGTELTITVTEAEGSAPSEWTLTCGSEPGGDHPDPAAACAALQAAVDGGDDPFAPLATDAVCTEIYGGSATATITGDLGRRGRRRVVLPDERLRDCALGSVDGRLPHDGHHRLGEVDAEAARPLTRARPSDVGFRGISGRRSIVARSTGVSSVGTPVNNASFDRFGHAPDATIDRRALKATFGPEYSPIARNA